MTERLGEWGDEPPIQDKFVIQIPAKAGISSSPHSRRLVIPAKMELQKAGTLLLSILSSKDL